MLDGEWGAYFSLVSGELRGTVGAPRCVAEAAQHCPLVACTLAWQHCLLVSPSDPAPGRSPHGLCKKHPQVYSYHVNFARVGVMIILVHDVSDIFLEAAKLARCVAGHGADVAWGGTVWHGAGAVTRCVAGHGTGCGTWAWWMGAWFANDSVDSHDGCDVTV